MPADVVRPDRDGIGEETPLLQPPSRQIAHDHGATVSAEPCAQLGQLHGGEMMQDQIANHHPILGPLLESENILLMPARRGRPLLRTGSAIDAIPGYAGAVHPEPELAGAGPELKDAFAFRDQSRDDSLQPGGVSQRRVEVAQVATGRPCIRVIRRQPVENFGRERLGTGGECEGHAAKKGGEPFQRAEGTRALREPTMGR